MSDGAQQSGGFTAYGAAAVSERLQKMLVHARAVRRGDDVEALHDMRVASRRLRAAISIFEPAFRGTRFLKFQAEIRRVTRALGEARDLDVMIETLETLAATVPTTQRAGIDALVERRRAERLTSQYAVMAAMERVESRDLAVWFAEIAAEAAIHNAPIPATTEDHDATA